jgi:hypothetical protein
MRAVILFYPIVMQNVMIEWAALLFRIREVPNLNLTAEINYSYWGFPWFSSALSVDAFETWNWVYTISFNIFAVQFYTE